MNCVLRDSFSEAPYLTKRLQCKIHFHTVTYSLSQKTERIVARSSLIFHRFQPSIHDVFVMFCRRSDSDSNLHLVWLEAHKHSTREDFFFADEQASTDADQISVHRIESWPLLRWKLQMDSHLWRTVQLLRFASYMIIISYVERLPLLRAGGQGEWRKS